MSMDKRIDGAQFHIGTPVCLFCRNVQRHKYSDATPNAPTMTCSVLGEIPPEIDLAETQKCSRFILDAEKYEREKDWLPKEFNPDEINK